MSTQIKSLVDEWGQGEGLDWKITNSELQRIHCFLLRSMFLADTSRCKTLCLKEARECFEMPSPISGMDGSSIISNEKFYDRLESCYEEIYHFGVCD